MAHASSIPNIVRGFIDDFNSKPSQEIIKIVNGDYSQFDLDALQELLERNSFTGFRYKRLSPNQLTGESRVQIVVRTDDRPKRWLMNTEVSVIVDTINDDMFFQMMENKKTGQTSNDLKLHVYMKSQVHASAVCAVLSDPSGLYAWKSATYEVIEEDPAPLGKPDCYLFLVTLSRGRLSL